MIYLLIISMLILSIISFLVGKKRLVYPPFILNTTFFLSGCLSLFYKYDIGYEIGLKTYLLVVGFNLAFTIVYILLGIKGKEINKVEIRETHISNLKILLLYGCQIMALVLFFLFFIEELELKSFSNLSEKINEFRVGISFDGTFTLPKYISIMSNISYAITIVVTYILVKNFIASKSKKVFLMNALKLVPAYILYFPIIILMGERFNILILFLVAFSSYFILYYKNNTPNQMSIKKLLALLACSVVVLVTVFSGSRFLVGRGEDRSLIHYIAEYFGNSLINLDYFLKNPTHTDCFGEETFYAINKLLSDLGLVENFDSAYQLPFAVEGNTYTAYRKYFADFSYYGIFLIIILSVICFILEKLTYNSQKKQDYIIVLYSCFLSSIFLTFYSDTFYGTYLSLGYLSIVIYIFMVMWLVTNFNFIDSLENKIRNKIIIKKMKKKEVVSFDLYDTLVNRYTNDNKEVYDLVKKYCNENDIKIDENYIDKRKKADYLKGVETKSLLELYKEVEMEGDLEGLKEIEEEIESNIVYRNKKNNYLYNTACELNKKIIITTDIHLSYETIKKVLDRCKIQYYKLYVSSELKKSKKEGTIFEYIEKDLNVKKKDIIHFGDNVISDKKNPRKNYWDSVYLKKINDSMLTAYDRFIENGANTQNTKYKKYGYKAMGPLLYFYSLWLSKESNEQKLSFLSRDGKIMKEAYDIVNKGNESEYLYASRRALIVPSIFKIDNFEDIMKSYFYGKTITLSKFLFYMGLDYEILEHDELFNLTNEEDIEKLEVYYEKYKEKIHKNSKEQNKLLLEYLGERKNLNIVDIGWFGNMQKSLENILSSKNISVRGYYLGLLSKSENKKGYLFEHKGEELQLEEELFNSLIEFIFSTNHGTVLGYKKDAKCIKPVLADYEYQNSKTDYILRDIQIGALEFVKEFDFVNKYLFIDKMPAESFSNIRSIFLFPTTKVANDWGDITFCDYDERKIAAPKSIFFYMIHPKKLVEDFKNSLWRQGFVKRLFKFNLPYSNLMKWYKRRKYNAK